MFFGRIGRKVHVFLELRGKLACISGVHAAVDLRVSADKGHFFDKHNVFCTVCLGAVSGRKTREASAYDDNVMGFVPFCRRRAAVVLILGGGSRLFSGFKIGRISAGFFNRRFNCI